MNKKELILTIFKTGLSTLLFVGGIYLVATSKERWEQFVGGLVSIRDLEMSRGSVIGLKIFGSLLIVTGLFLAFFFFIYDPDAALRRELEETAQYLRHCLPVDFSATV